MRNRTLTGQWAGFSFQNGCLVTPEGRSMYPWQLNYLGLTCGIAHEWKRMMDDEKAARARSVIAGKRYQATDSGESSSAEEKVIYLRDVIRRGREERSAGSG
ncbi:phage protein [Xanthomonas fragariae]|nr:phage protein [Xanthomonas fragariae]UKR54129.1 phage protein [Xanthomonas fragariae]